MNHDALQQKCWVHLWNTYPETRYNCWHTKNEDIPHKSESKQDYIKRRSQDKAKGLLPGVYDLVFYWKGCLHAFDIKVGRDKLSEQQIRFAEATIRQGGKAYEIREFDTFVSIIAGIMSNTDHTGTL